MKHIFVLSFLLFLVINVQAQPYDPLTLSKKIFSRDSLPDFNKYCIGEFQGHPNGNDLPLNIKTTFTLLGQNNSTAVVNITLSDSNGKSYDTYLHFRKDTIWKAAAFRALSLVGIVESINQQLISLSPKQVDSIIAAPNSKEKMFTSKEEYQYLLGNTTLTLASDAQLIDHFNKNKAAFEKLKDELISNGIFKLTRGAKDMKNASLYKKRLKALWLSNVFPDRESSASNLNFLIGGITDNSVGYLYIKDKKDVPEMSPGSFIMIRKLADGWYMYKTT